MYSREELSRDLRAAGVAPGDVVMLHASVRSVGPIAGGPDQIHLALKDAVTSEGTVLMYTGTADYFDDVGRGNLTPEQESEVLAKLPAYDALTSRCARDNGILVEFLRTYPGTRVNRHPARFAAWGKQVDFLFSQQPWDYAFGRGSLLERFVELEGRILLLGCDHDNVTFLHYAEHIADIPNKRVARFKVPVFENGARVWKDMEEFDTSAAGAHAHWPRDLFARIVDTHIAEQNISAGRVGDAECYLLNSAALLTFALQVMHAVAGDASAAERLLVRPGRSAH